MRRPLVARFSSVDPSSVYPSDKAGYLGYGQFFSIYGVALDGRLTPRNIERHSRNWLSETYNATSLLIPAVEAATLANALEGAGNLYGAYQARLALARVCLDAAFDSIGPDPAFFSSVATEAIADSIIAAERFSDRVWDLREGREKKLLHVVGGGSGTSFLIHSFVRRSERHSHFLTLEVPTRPSDSPTLAA